MNFYFAEQINCDLQNLDFEKAINTAENELNKIAKTEFHEIIDKTFTNPIDNLVNWISRFFNEISKKFEIKAMYFEMNEFDINTNVWYIDGIAYKEDGGLDLDNMNWLSDCKRDVMTTEEFVLTGFENFQKSFETIEVKEENDEWTDEMQEARDWCEQIIISRFMELMTKAHETAKKRELDWGNVPIYFTEHAYDFIVKSDVKKNASC
ncbi:hypothetical protein [Flavobacterium collinsii]|uniref:Uncharacterized protein n=1 Tax=Flavobacterium collinsii TaxID=1114861 RepID=A0ABM8KHP5_9FLAO|nr:hypothetical protein [Flavobacterium collinsii]CAA9197846.1 hypothetical protein FLACOL7796_01896 [Flavobacterium collinsii]